MQTNNVDTALPPDYVPGLWQSALFLLCRSDSIVFLLPVLNHHLSFFQRIEALSVQQIIPQLSVEAFATSILPWAVWFDESRVHPEIEKGNPFNLGGNLAWMLPV